MAKRKGNMFDLEAELEIGRRDKEKSSASTGKPQGSPFDKEHTLIIGADEWLFQFMAFLRFSNKPKTNTQLVTDAIVGHYAKEAEIFSALKPELPGQPKVVDDE